MTDDERALLAGVAASPNDDVPRLVLADALDENASSMECPECKGEREWPLYEEDYVGPKLRCWTCDGRGNVSDGRAERAMFIRGQIKNPYLALPGVVVREFAALFGVSARELGRSGFTFGSRLSFATPSIVAAEWRRGFIERIELPLAAFMAHAADLFSRHPVIRDVRLSDREPGEQRYYSGHGWYWYGRELANIVIEPDDLPPAIYRWLTAPMQADGFRGYPTPELAHAALSAACCRYGRSLAQSAVLV